MITSHFSFRPGTETLLQSELKKSGFSHPVHMFPAVCIPKVLMVVARVFMGARGNPPQTSPLIFMAVGIPPLIRKSVLT